MTIRNTGDGAFDDGFLVVTLQRREGRQSKFMRRRHGDLLPIAPGEEQTISQRWDISELEPGTYYFYGHVNYKHLWDTNSLDTFDSEDFEVVGEARSKHDQVRRALSSRSSERSCWCLASQCPLAGPANYA